MRDIKFRVFLKLQQEFKYFNLFDLDEENGEAHGTKDSRFMMEKIGRHTILRTPPCRIIQLLISP